ncbi:MAG: extracellular solute-binding protein, partial [Anaerolineales bacterium]|nr:extracellular solute-binding protein [Anaerolineales bacterium]
MVAFDFFRFVARASVIISSAALIACAPRASEAPAPAAPPPIVSPSAPAPTIAATIVPTRAIPTRTPLATTSAITLTLWATEELAPGASPAGRVLKNQFDAFTAANPNIHIEVVLKKPYGKGGILDFLLTTSAVVPTQLPDFVTLDIAEVPLAAEAGILQPLDAWLPSDLKNDFFPFAFRAAHYQNQWIAFPFVADAQHLVYTKTTIKKAPATWDECLKQKTPLLLPLGGDDAFVLQHLALASTGDGFLPMPTDANNLAQILTFFKRARDQNLLPETAINLKSIEEVWAPFAASQTALAQVSASRYLAEREKAPQAGFAAVPTRDGKTATVASGWAFALVTNDPSRQAAATRFMQWLTYGERLAPFLRAAKRLPATRATVALAVDPPEYAAFLRETLERGAYWASATPRETKIASAWRAAIAAVWKGTST